MPDFISGIAIICNEPVTADEIVRTAVGEDNEIIDGVLTDDGIAYASADLIRIGCLTVICIAGL